MMVFKREWKRAQKALWIWTLALGGMTFLIMSVYPQFAENKEQLQELMKLYPEAMLKAFNIDQLGFDSALGFYAIEGYLFVTLFGSIYAAMLAGGMLVKEESDRTIEFLLSKPISRVQVVVQKAAAVALVLVVFNTVLSAINYLGFQVAGDDHIDMVTFTLISLAPLLLHLTFAALAFGLSAFFRKQRLVTSISLAIVLFSYFVSIVASISDQLSKLKWISPFEYVNSAYIIEQASIKPVYLIIMILIMVISLTAAIMKYMKKDLVI
jgi:ABC-2 type transport system permease protein